MTSSEPGVPALSLSLSLSTQEAPGIADPTNPWHQGPPQSSERAGAGCSGTTCVVHRARGRQGTVQETCSKPHRGVCLAPHKRAPVVGLAGPGTLCRRSSCCSSEVPKAQRTKAVETVAWDGDKPGRRKVVYLEGPVLYAVHKAAALVMIVAFALATVAVKVW